VYRVKVDISEYRPAIVGADQLHSESMVQISRRNKAEAFSAAIGHLLAMGGKELEAYLLEQATLLKQVRDLVRRIHEDDEPKES
jgi:hypothetical protein